MLLLIGKTRWEQSDIDLIWKIWFLKTAETYDRLEEGFTIAQTSFDIAMIVIRAFSHEWHLFCICNPLNSIMPWQWFSPLSSYDTLQFKEINCHEKNKTIQNSIGGFTIPKFLSQVHWIGALSWELQISSFAGFINLR